mmetsp:Transcript_46640/g.107749  ORF Transcript_46640/g.107749 Transcript_46640/m.107749 type:complete len:164 (+) Transcript_46640:135-626(+)
MASTTSRSRPHGHGVWKCRTFPALHPSLEGHILGKSSQTAIERWLQPEAAVGAKAWKKVSPSAKARGSQRAHTEDEVKERTPPQRAAARTASAPQRHWRGAAEHPRDPYAPLLTGGSASPSFPANRRSSLGTQKERSMPNLDAGELPFPPSPAYVRVRMREFT